MRAKNPDSGKGARDVSAHLRLEPLRDQVFAACGYAFVIAALTTALLTPHLGQLAIITGIALTAVLVPVNFSLIRRFARLRRSLAEHQSSAPAGRAARTTSSRHS